MPTPTFSLLSIVTAVASAAAVNSVDTIGYVSGLVIRVLPDYP